MSGKRVLGLTEEQINEAWREEISQPIASGYGFAKRLDFLANYGGDADTPHGVIWLLHAFVVTLDGLPPTVFDKFVDQRLVDSAKKLLNDK